MKLTKREKDKLKHVNATQEANPTSNITAEKLTAKALSKNGNKKFILYILLAFAVFFGAIAAYARYSAAKPGQYDSFAKCLTEKGVKVYGALSWCKYTQAQKAMFGKSFKFLDYEEHTNLPRIKRTPTWVINGKWYENVQSLQRLSELTGCILN